MIDKKVCEFKVNEKESCIIWKHDEDDFSYFIGDPKDDTSGFSVRGRAKEILDDLSDFFNQ